jgi:hypothetical protein
MFAVPEELSSMMPGRFYRSNFNESEAATIHAFVNKLLLGIHARPCRWKDSDGSWKERRRCG